MPVAPLDSASHLPNQSVSVLGSSELSAARFANLHLLDTEPAYSLKTHLRRRLVRGLHYLSHCSGLSSLYARIKARVKGESVATVLMYHSVPAPHERPWMDPRNCLMPEQFEAQMAFLARYRNVISMEQLIRQLAKRRPIRRGTVAITFDDGYLNNLRVAAPILAKYSLPATLYLATAYVAAGQNQWIDTLYSAFRARSQHRLNLSALGWGDWQLSDVSVCESAYRAIASRLIECLPAQRQAVLSEIDAQLAPTVYPPRLTMNWDEVRELRERFPNVTLGVHTANHIDLSTHSEQCDREMELSIAQVLAETGDRPQHLAFPYNRYNAHSQEQVAAHLRSAVAMTADPVVRATTPRYAIPRLEAPQELWLLKSWTDGGFPDFTQRFFGRAWTSAH